MSIASEIQRLQTAKADIKAAIEEKGVAVGDDTIDTYAAKIGEISGGGSGDYEQGYEDGKNSVVPLDRYMKSVRFTSLNMFGTKEAVLNLDNINGLANLFQITDEESVNTTVEHLTINALDTPYTITSINQMLYCQYPYVDNTLKKVTFKANTQSCSNFLNAFTQLRALEIIDGTPLDFSNVISASNTNAFPTNPSLQEVRFVPNSIKVSIKFANSSQLSADTIQSVIDGLANLSGSYYTVGDAVATDVFDYRATPDLVTNVISAEKVDNFFMVDDAPVYLVLYGNPSNPSQCYAYKVGGSDAQTLTLHADVKAKLTDEQKATISKKNWILAK